MRMATWLPYSCPQRQWAWRPRPWFEVTDLKSLTVPLFFTDELQTENKYIQPVFVCFFKRSLVNILVLMSTAGRTTRFWDCLTRTKSKIIQKTSGQTRTIFFRFSWVMCIFKARTKKKRPKKTFSGRWDIVFQIETSGNPNSRASTLKCMSLSVMYSMLKSIAALDTFRLTKPEKWRATIRRTYFCRHRTIYNGI